MAGNKNSGRRPANYGFRAWCRGVVMQPEVKALLSETAKQDPVFALKLAEHGFGRPPQPLDVSVDDKRETRYLPALPDGTPLFTGPTAVPDPGPN